MNKFELTVLYGSIFSPLIPLAFAVKRHNYISRIILVLVILSFSSDLYSLASIKLGWIRNNNFLFLSIYGLLESSIIIYYFYYKLNKPKWILIIAIPFFIFYIIDFLFFEYGSFNSLGRGIQCLLVLILCVIFFYNVYKEERIVSLEKEPTFWFCTALFIYFSGAMVSLVLANTLLSSNFTWQFHNISNILKNIILAVGFYRLK